MTTADSAARREASHAKLTEKLGLTGVRSGQPAPLLAPERYHPDLIRDRAGAMFALLLDSVTPAQPDQSRHEGEPAIMSPTPTIPPALAEVAADWQVWADHKDGEHAAALTFLLGAPEISGDPRFTDHVDGTAIDWEAIVADKTWQPHELILIKTAFSCFRAGLRSGQAGFEIHPGQVANAMPDADYALWLAIIHAVRTGIVPPLPLSS